MNCNVSYSLFWESNWYKKTTLICHIKILFFKPHVRYPVYLLQLVTVDIWYDHVSVHRCSPFALICLWLDGVPLESMLAASSRVNWNSLYLTLPRTSFRYSRCGWNTVCCTLRLVSDSVDRITETSHGTGVWALFTLFSLISFPVRDRAGGVFRRAGNRRHAPCVCSSDLCEGKRSPSGWIFPRRALCTGSSWPMRCSSLGKCFRSDGDCGIHFPFVSEFQTCM